MKKFKDFVSGHEVFEESSRTDSEFNISPIQIVDGRVQMIDNEDFVELRKFRLDMTHVPSCIFTFLVDKKNFIGYVYCLGLIEGHEFIKILYKEQFSSEEKAMKEMEARYTSFSFKSF